jgi:hypothetical protein
MTWIGHTGLIMIDETRGYGLFTRDVDKRGVAVRRGKWANPEWRELLWMFPIGPILAIASYVAWLMAGPPKPLMWLWLLLNVVALSAFTAVIISKVASVRRQLRNLLPAREIALRLGVEDERVDELIGYSKPRVNINGEDYYDPVELTEASLLLRPSGREASGELLRAAGSSASQEEQGLLRAGSDGMG